jgi:hypothetical protein
MNLFKALVSMFAESSFEDMVVQFAASKLKTSEVCLLISDANQTTVYETVMKKLRGMESFLTIADIGLLPQTLCTEVLIVHTHFDADLLERVVTVPFVSRVIYIAENTLVNQAATAVEAIQQHVNAHQIHGESVDIVFAYQDQVRYPSQLRLADPNVGGMFALVETE